MIDTGGMLAMFPKFSFSKIMVKGTEYGHQIALKTVSSLSLLMFIVSVAIVWVRQGLHEQNGRTLGISFAALLQ
jgi:hypothetical protein